MQTHVNRGTLIDLSIDLSVDLLSEYLSLNYECLSVYPSIYLARWLVV